MNVVKQNSSQILDLLKSEPGLASFLRPGDLIGGKILEKGSNRILIDLGKAGTGIIYRSEIQNAKEIIRNLKEGDEINGKVIQIDNEEGMVELSLSQADKQKAWSDVQELKEKEEVLVIKPIKFNRGGLLAEISGLLAFLPVSQLSNEHYPKAASAEDLTKISSTLESLVGTEISVRIIDINPRNNKLIVSERAANEISAKELAKNYSVGQIIEGVISGVADFGAFVRFTDNPAVEGLIHVSEIDWRQVENPKEVINVDDAVKAKIIDIKDGKISLSLKSLKADPWESVSERYKEGDEVAGSVYSFNPFGAVISMDKEIQGQIHVTEFGGVEEMKKALAVQKDYKFIIQSVHPTERRIVLKLKK